MSITYSECVSVALGIRHAKRCYHLWPVWLYYIFCIFSRKRNDFRGVGEITERKMCVSVFSTNVVWNISHSK